MKKVYNKGTSRPQTFKVLQTVEEEYKLNENIFIELSCEYYNNKTSIYLINSNRKMFKYSKMPRNGKGYNILLTNKNNNKEFLIKDYHFTTINLSKIINANDIPLFLNMTFLNPKQEPIQELNVPVRILDYTKSKYHSIFLFDYDIQKYPGFVHDRRLSSTKDDFKKMVKNNLRMFKLESNWKAPANNVDDLLKERFFHDSYIKHPVYGFIFKSAPNIIIQNIKTNEIIKEYRNLSIYNNSKLYKLNDDVDMNDYDIIIIDYDGRNCLMTNFFDGYTVDEFVEKVF